MSEPIRLTLQDAAATQRAGQAIGRAIQACAGVHLVIGLTGELGAGKTTLVAGVLGAVGIQSGARSPTYTLIEPYEIAGRPLYHLDLYRLRSADELEDLGIRELLAPPNVLLIEWIERGPVLAERQDVAIRLDYASTAEKGREFTAAAHSEAGERVAEAILGALSQQ